MRLKLQRRPFLASGLAAAGLARFGGRALADDTRFLRIGTGSVTGTYYPIGALIAGALSRPSGARPCTEAGACGVADLTLVVEASKGSVDNVEAIRAGRIETGFAQSDVAYGAYAGTGVFEGQPPLVSLRALASLYLESIHIVVTPSSGITKVADLRGRRVSLDAEGSGTLVDARLILAGFGLTPADLQPVYATPSRSIDLMREGQLDALFLVAGFPAAAVAELVEAVGARLLPIVGPPVGTLLKQHRFLTPADIPGDTYAGIEMGIPTLGVAALWVATAELDETLAYEITQALWNPATLKVLDEGHPKGSEIQAADALRGVAIPVHPGAARYYRERGLAE
ncbi:MAG: TAXI family TRAP transporter solute-binding subunit [Geminicoccaceae bacterium]